MIILKKCLRSFSLAVLHFDALSKIMWLRFQGEYINTFADSGIGACKFSSAKDSNPFSLCVLHLYDAFSHF